MSDRDDKYRALDTGLIAIAAIDLELYPQLNLEESLAFFDSYDSNELIAGLILVISLYADVLASDDIQRDEVFTHIAYDSLMRGLSHKLSKQTEEYFVYLKSDFKRSEAIRDEIDFFEWRNCLMHFAVSIIDYSKNTIGGTRKMSIEMMRDLILRTMSII